MPPEFDEFKKMEKESRKFERSIVELKELEGKAPKLFGIPTGTKLDEMFFTVEIDEKTGKARKKILGGLPYLAVVNVVGVPDTGKSVLAEQFAVNQAARGYKVLFVTVESPSEFLFNSLKQKALALGYDFSKLEDNIIVIDAAKVEEIRENVISLIKTMDYVIKKFGTTITVIDSITGLYEHREMLARQIVRRIYNFLKEKRQTALLVSQKRSSQGAETAEAAGGLAVAHIVDSTIVLDKKLIASKWDESTFKLPLGSVVRLLRIDGCRMSGHDSDTWIFEINEFGLIDIKKKLKDLIKR